MSWLDNLVKLDSPDTAGKKTVLVTGASGYIGSHICVALKDVGHSVVAVDRNPVRLHNSYDVYVQGDYADDITMQTAMVQNKVDAVVHIGATSLVGPSVTDPGAYYKNNVEGTRCLLEACKIQGVKQFVFASSAATYGDASGVCHETNSNLPCNPYGWSKWMTEQMLRDYHVAYGIRSVAFRYFNVAGASRHMGQVKDATHLVARIMESAMNEQQFTIFGTHYPTIDGTCVRDYVHVEDVADAHVLALELLDFYDENFTMNLGSGVGNSVYDIIGAVREYTPLRVKYTTGSARAGDPAELVSSIASTQKILGWKPNLGIDKVVESAYNWYKSDTYNNLK